MFGFIQKKLQNQAIGDFGYMAFFQPKHNKLLIETQPHSESTQHKHLDFIRIRDRLFACSVW